jgi:H+-transporting ATPase
MRCRIRPLIRFEMLWPSSGRLSRGCSKPPSCFKWCLHKYFEASVIAGLLVFNAALAYFQEGRAQATLAALKSRLALNASVRRDGAWKTVPAAELVRGDLVKLSLGGVVAADVHLVEGSVSLDQSMLTGESLPLEAGPGVDTYAGALVRRGEATAEVTATGVHTKFGRTAELVRTAHVVSSQQKAVLRIVRNLAIFNGGVILLIGAYAFTHSMPWSEIIPCCLHRFSRRYRWRCRQPSPWRLRSERALWQSWASFRHGSPL